MLTTIDQFTGIAQDDNGVPLPILKGWLAAQELTATGAAAALHANAKFVRIATDTAVKVDAYGAGSKVLLPAGAVEVFPVAGAQVLTFS